MKRRRILLVDDEPGFTKIVKLILEERYGYEVREENNPTRALQDAREFSPNIILLDVVMPRMDGGEVYAQLKADPVLRHIPVIFITAIVDEREVSERAGIIGGAVFMSKPVRINDLNERIETHALLS
jgi:CheY-like chemotaxis protein